MLSTDLRHVHNKNDNYNGNNKDSSKYKTITEFTPQLTQ